VIIYTVFGEEEVSSKVCIYCKIEQPLSEFPKHRNNKKDRLDTRCRTCIKKRAAEVKELRKTAPPVPEFCDCGCGRKLESPRLDHDPKTGKFRGWLTDECNRGLGILGDTVEDLERYVQYLKRTNG
jgi:hypothetical protein